MLFHFPILVLIIGFFFILAFRSKSNRYGNGLLEFLADHPVLGFILVWVICTSVNTAMNTRQISLVFREVETTKTKGLDKNSKDSIEKEKNK
jgi:cytochrome b561